MLTYYGLIREPKWPDCVALTISHKSKYYVIHTQHGTPAVMPPGCM